jgi:hypothetical protein
MIIFDYIKKYFMCNLCKSLEKEREREKETSIVIEDFQDWMNIEIPEC